MFFPVSREQSKKSRGGGQGCENRVRPGPNVPLICIVLWAPLGSSWLLTSNPAAGDTSPAQPCAAPALGPSALSLEWSRALLPEAGGVERGVRCGVDVSRVGLGNYPFGLELCRPGFLESRLL